MGVKRNSLDMLFDLGAFKSFFKELKRTIEKLLDQLFPDHPEVKDEIREDLNG
jgi:hypothetical protein